ncbi:MULTISPECIES: metallophosphoesterase family protein [Brevibacillus]|uniref:metallophosphoesterase family protein n=1 Tax=Brevibacillus TaxID=55080 RepID=UPI0004F2EF00|nr:metallophosphoesterase family protein [Brevibacillus borstelensis]KKX55513.1 phosphodiesterase [Brevibacillus borstelensis cifa_chp40]
MKIGVVSDTHLPRRGHTLPKPLIEGLRGVELIIHAGDWNTLQVYEELSEIAHVVGVWGNTDDDQVKARLNRVEIVEAKGKRIGVVHGDGKGKTTPQRAVDTFSGQTVDLIIFGHSHIPLWEERNGILLFNPGSPTDKRKQPLYTYGIVEIGAEITARHEAYEQK